MTLPQPPPLPGKQEAQADPANRSKARKVAAITSCCIILVYSGLYRWIFAEPWMEHSGGVVSMSFIFSVPFACGALTVAIGRWYGSDNWIIHAIVLPIFALSVGLFISVLTQLEAMICVVMAMPILFFASILGGLITHALLPRNHTQQRLYVTMAVFLPFIASYCEARLSAISEIRAISNSITINAPAEKIWPLIASVDAIDADSIPNKWIYRIGFPKPIAATLDHEGVGGIRIATFERGVSFFEQVTEWNEPEKLSFSIHADPDFIPKTAFDQHIIVGGRFYDVLDGTYQIEPTSASSCRLHLTSNHRLSTRFNAYAGWWSVKIMDQIQGSILEVIRERAETKG